VLHGVGAAFGSIERGGEPEKRIPVGGPSRSTRRVSMVVARLVPRHFSLPRAAVIRCSEAGHRLQTLAAD
jgi:hypothetical protein